MKRKPISSQAIASVGYDATTQILEVEFTSGDVYHYFDVSPFEKEALLRADSSGAYLNQRIKPRHRYQEVPS
ncbi:MAG: KTSC domain-containing protein [Jiangellaceae bacterium]